MRLYCQPLHHLRITIQKRSGLLSWELFCFMRIHQYMLPVWPNTFFHNFDQKCSITWSITQTCHRVSLTYFDSRRQVLGRKKFCTNGIYEGAVETCFNTLEEIIYEEGIGNSPISITNVSNFMLTMRKRN